MIVVFILSLQEFPLVRFIQHAELLYRHFVQAGLALKCLEFDVIELGIVKIFDETNYSSRNVSLSWGCYGLRYSLQLL